jgi:hypothetical protein
MPWLAVDDEYEFDGPRGRVKLIDLFEGRRQLIVYRAFFEPGVHGWPEHACMGCSFVTADQIGNLAHLNARDTTLVFASRAPQADIERLKARMGWAMPWYTTADSFDADFGVDEWHGTNVFIRRDDRVFRTYFVNGRGDEALSNTFSYLDITPLGRQELWEDSPEGNPLLPGVAPASTSPTAKRANGWSTSGAAPHLRCAHQFLRASVRVAAARSKARIVEVSASDSQTNRQWWGVAS